MQIAKIFQLNLSRIFSAEQRGHGIKEESEAQSYEKALNNPAVKKAEAQSEKNPRRNE